jgi:uncharacterized protein YcaQ
MMTTIRRITPRTARRLAVSSQMLSGPVPAANAQEIMKLFHNLGCVQIDPLRAVGRTQLLVLWSRLGNYDVSELDGLLWKERTLFEYWAHAASIVRIKDFPIYWRHMRDWAAGDKSWNKRAKEWMDQNLDLRDHVLGEITESGPLPSKAFHDSANVKWRSGGWTNGQNVRSMLTYLWEQGEIMVSHRQGLIKYWDLADRCLPSWTPRENLTWSQTVFRAAQRSLIALGVGTQGHIKRHFTRGNYPDLDNELKKLESNQLIQQIEIAEGDLVWPGTWFIHQDSLLLLERIESGDWQPRTTLLSPFDNLICHRERSEELFGFHYRIEIYVPKAKRQYGYYVVPILHGDQIIGRIDPKMDRKKKQLVINEIYAEPSAPMTVETSRSIAGSLEELAKFLGAKKIVLLKKPPYGWRSGLKF